MTGLLEKQKDLEEQLRAFDREYHFAAILRTTHPDYLYTHLGPFDTVEEAYEAKERFKAELHKLLGHKFWKFLPKHEQSTVTLAIEHRSRIAINKAIKEEYSQDSTPDS